MVAFLACSAATQASGPQTMAEWVNWGKSAGAAHAADLAKRGLENNYVGCGIRASLELASKVRRVTADPRYAFFTAFQTACTVAGGAASSPARAH